MPAYVDVILTIGWFVAGGGALFTLFFAAVVVREELASGRTGSGGGFHRDRRGRAPGRRATDRR